ncbi:S8 family peptidase [Phytoactinopolyspora mesophila]|uniref:S8 family serine peptidase n=1 Tax=Phytoactinopolyspora mesophila TaxID=2650750 RepID=A0A7K3M625_9ACTN|nr:S8 family peptidase [Phytoactinopolyspora mesophila]NDL58670.1 S8 family serine peptidase [Phytoactinopolyspora mesophila]
MLPLSRLRHVVAGFVLITLAATTGISVSTATSPGHHPPFALGSTSGDGIPRGVSHTVMLVTGDVVRVERAGAGRQVVTVEPAEGRELIDFHQLELDGELFVIPHVAIPYLDGDQLDQALFNVDQLIEQGYHDEAMDTLPLIVRYGDAAAPFGDDTTDVLASAEHELSLESVDAHAISVDKRDAAAFWDSVDNRDDADVSATLDHDIEMIWLDAKVEPALEHSVEQIGAPAAWEHELDGTGITVAVLDTGIDTEHPDLAGKISDERDFTGSGSTNDLIGHGTHVAATIAGSGAASDGLRTGVAPGAELLNGKVLDDGGTGLSSWIIEGMEWAVAAGADIVNLSLGGGPTDGTDPMSLALNALTEETGALFVVAAGNSGPASTTVGTPGSADAALTVGAVDRDESLARFSSRGPRLGDLAIKPEITAPGVGITAARAAGTSMGSPVDEFYTAANGTSMATPHVAGAAAILAQRHAGWTADELKDALVSTSVAAAEYTADEQGGGRVDVARAVGPGLYASGMVHLGTFTEDDDEHTRTDVVYTNTTDTDVDLELDLTLTTAGGDEPGENAVSLEQRHLRVPAGSTASVEVVVAPDVLERGRYSGRLTARAGHTEVGSVISLLKEPPMHTVTFSVTDPDGRPGTALPLAVYGDDPRFDMVTDLWQPGQTITREFGEGSYYVFANMDHWDDEYGESAHVVVLPELEITEDMDVVLDARDAVEVEIETPKPAEQTGIYSYYAYRDIGSRTVGNAVMKFPHTERLFVTPTEAVSGGFEFNSRWQLRAPMLTAEVVGRPRQELDLYYYSPSIALEGTTTLPVVHVGEGTPEDYAGVDVRDAMALVTPSGDPDFNALTEVAADAGAAMAAFVPPGTYSWFSEWQPGDYRLPAMSTFVPPRQAGPLLELLAERDVKVRLTGMIDSPYLYDVMQVSEGRIPERVRHVVDRDTSATVINRYHGTGGDEWVKEQRFGWREWMGSVINQTERHLRSPHVREETVSSGGTLWQHRVRHDSPWLSGIPVQGGMTHLPRTYESGERLNTDWHQAVVRPAIPRAVDGLTSYREGDVLTIRIPEFADSSSDHYGFAEDADEAWGDEVTARLYQDEELIFEGIGAWGDYLVAAGPARYRLDLDVERDQPEWEFSPRTSTTWTFTSARPAQPEEPLPLIQIDYDVPTDVRNQAPAGRVVHLGLTARHQDGLGELDVVRMSVRTSYDDGTTWEDVRLLDDGAGEYRALVRHPPLRATDGYVWLQVEAEDDAGNIVKQTIERAYGLGGR